MKRILHATFLLAFACAAFVAFSTLAQAQKVDVGFGMSTILAPSANGYLGENNGHEPVSQAGGLYPGFSGDVLFWHNVGLGGEIFWRGSQLNYGSQLNLPVRPIFYAFNGVYSPKIANHTYLEVVAGIGAQSTRQYCGASCYDPYTNTTFVSDTHFMGDFGGGIKFYPWGGLFVRPEARVYLINNNLLFSSNHAIRVGASIGYTFGRH